MSCVQEIPYNINKLQVELLETRRDQVSQLNQIVDEINQQMCSIQIDKVRMLHLLHKSAVCMYITFRKHLILQVDNQVLSL